MLKTKQLAHTPLPWKATRSWGGMNIEGPLGQDIGYINSSDGADEPEIYPDKENASIIVLAINNHQKLVDALRRVCKAPYDRTLDDWDNAHKLLDELDAQVQAAPEKEM